MEVNGVGGFIESLHLHAVARFQLRAVPFRNIEPSLVGISQPERQILMLQDLLLKFLLSTKPL